MKINIRNSIFLCDLLAGGSVLAEQIVVGSVALPGVARKRRNNDRGSAFPLYLINITFEICGVTLECLKRLQFLVIMAKLEQAVVTGLDVVEDNILVPLAAHRLGRKPRVRLVRDRKSIPHEI